MHKNQIETYAIFNERKRHRDKEKREEERIKELDAVEQKLADERRAEADDIASEAADLVLAAPQKLQEQEGFYEFCEEIVKYVRSKI